MRTTPVESEILRDWLLSTIPKDAAYDLRYWEYKDNPTSNNHIITALITYVHGLQTRIHQLEEQIGSIRVETKVIIR